MSQWYQWPPSRTKIGCTLVPANRLRQASKYYVKTYSSNFGYSDHIKPDGSVDTESKKQSTERKLDPGKQTPCAVHIFQLSRCGAKICEKQSNPPTLGLSFKISPRSRECKPRLNIFLPTSYYSSSWFEVLLVESVTVWGGVLDPHCFIVSYQHVIPVLHNSILFFLAERFSLY